MRKERLTEWRNRKCWILWMSTRNKFNDSRIKRFWSNRIKHTLETEHIFKYYDFRIINMEKNLEILIENFIIMENELVKINELRIPKFYFITHLTLAINILQLHKVTRNIFIIAPSSNTLLDPPLWPNAQMNSLLRSTHHFLNIQQSVSIL